MPRITRPETLSLAPTIQILLPSFQRGLLAQNKSPMTVKTYLESLRLLDGFLENQGMPQIVAHLHREHVESFIADLLCRVQASTANNRYRGIQQFFKWCLEEGEIRESPMARMKPPKVPESLPPMRTEEELRRLLKACEGTTFLDRRDMALVWLFLDTGARRSEVANLKVGDIDFQGSVALVVGKGGRPRACRFDRKTAQALDRYFRIRTRHRDAESPSLWLGHGGPMTDSGIAQAVRERAVKAGLEGLHLHEFRHLFAHKWLASGGQETDLMSLAGWKSRQMVSRYAASAAGERARDAHKRLGLWDGL